MSIVCGHRDHDTLVGGRQTIVTASVPSHINVKRKPLIYAFHYRTNVGPVNYATVHALQLDTV